ncbi:MAG: TIGR02266 family protein [candidate division NC10 bacterium]|nr:TIGR02266 family protein [candidate division NC10 bacterium]
MPSPREASAPESPPLPTGTRRYAEFEVYLPASCHLQGPDGTPLDLPGRTRVLSEGGVLLLLARPLPEGTAVTVELDSRSGPAARHGIGFEHPLERAFVEAVVVTHEPRGSPRAPVEVQVDYETAVADHSVNLSRSGIFVRTGEPVPRGETLTLRFHLPGVEGGFQVRGKVIWSNPEPGGTYPQGMGIRFERLPKAQAEQIAAFVSRVRRERGLDRLMDAFGERGEREGEGA